MSNAIPERPDPDAGAGTPDAEPPTTPAFQEPAGLPAAPAFPPASPFAAPSGPFGPQGPYGSPPSAAGGIDGRPIDGFAGPGHRAEPAASGHQADPAASGYQADPAASGYQADPTASGYQADPAASGYQADPAASGYQADPAASRHTADPAASGYQAAAGYQADPAAAGYPHAGYQGPGYQLAGYQAAGYPPAGYQADPTALGPIPGPWPQEPEAPKGPLDTLVTRSLVALGVGIFVALLGFPLGWLWESIVPRVPVVRQGQDFFYADPYGEQRAAQEGWFILLSVGVGIVLAILCWLLLRRFRGAPVAFALGLGGTVAGWLAWRFGHTIGYAHNLALQRAAKDGQTVYLPPDLRVRQKGDIAFWHHLPYISGVLLYLGIAALVTYLLFVAFTAHPDLRPRRRLRGQQTPAAPPAA